LPAEVACHPEAALLQEFGFGSDMIVKACSLHAHFECDVAHARRIETLFPEKFGCHPIDLFSPQADFLINRPVHNQTYRL
jgi:hypothetical protein